MLVDSVAEYISESRDNRNTNNNGRTMCGYSRAIISFRRTQSRVWL